MNWLLLAFAAQAVWGVVDILDKIILDRILRHSVVLAVSLGLLAIPLALGLGVLRGFEIVGPQTGIVVLSGVLFPVALSFYFKALSIDEAGRVVPLFQLTPLTVLLLSWLLLGDVLTSASYAGFALIFIGGLAISLRRGSSGLTVGRAFWLMLACTAIYGTAQVLVKVGASDFDVLDTVKWNTVGFALASVLFLLVPQTRRRFLEDFRGLSPAGWRYVVANQLVLSNLARFLFLTAIWAGPVSLVAVISGFEALFVLLYAGVLALVRPGFLDEQLNRSAVGVKLGALVIMVAGVGILDEVDLFGVFGG